MRLLARLLLLIIATDTGWEVTFDSHPDNRAVGITIQCEGFLSVNRRDIEPGMHTAWFPWVPMPDGCGVTAWVVRWVDEDPNREYVSEQATP